MCRTGSDDVNSLVTPFNTDYPLWPVGMVGNSTVYIGRIAFPTVGSRLIVVVGMVGVFCCWGG